MPKIAGPPLAKVTLNLFEEDVSWLHKHGGQGWSENIRNLVHEWIVERRSNKAWAKLLGGLDE